MIPRYKNKFKWHWLFKMGLSFRSLAIRNGSIWTGFHSRLEYRAYGKKIIKAQPLSRITEVSSFKNCRQLLAAFSWQYSLGCAPRRVKRVDCADCADREEGADCGERADRKDRADRKERANVKERADVKGGADRKKNVQSTANTQYVPLQTPCLYLT